MNVDDVTVNSCQFLTTINSNLYYQTVYYIENTNYTNVAKAIEDALKVYQISHFNVKQINFFNAF